MSAARGERTFAAGLLVCVALAIFLGIWDRFIVNDESKATSQLTASRIHIEKVTSLRRDTRKAHVALLESWLAPEAKRTEGKPALEKMVATVVGEQDEFRSLPATEDAEVPIRDRLGEAGAAWVALMTSTLDEDRGSERLADHKAALARVDLEADAILVLNSKSGEAVDQRIAALRGRQQRIEQGFVAAVLASIGLALFWRARRRAEANLLEAKRREEQRLIEVRSKFFQSMSHELRTPLVAITNLTATFKDEVASTPDKRQAYAKHVEREARDLLGMINNILDLAKLESEHAELLIEDVDLGEVLERCTARCRPLIGDKEVELELELGDPSAKVRADFVKLQQVFTNLIANAIKFTERGKVSVRSTAATSGRVQVEIADTGIGIEAGALGTIWSAFRQADSRISKKFGGTGLGLAIAKGVLDRIDGTVTIESTIGEGTTFTVTLPASTSASGG